MLPSPQLSLTFTADREKSLYHTHCWGVSVWLTLFLPLSDTSSQTG
uniref:Uncharacterized protein n=1 Tax=Anguilla anguilla TaxID=7936 RepID=A0A0E9W8D5_ANGAN